MRKLQENIISKFNVKPIINCLTEVEERVDFLKKYLISTNKKGFVLGISGGQDSLLAGKLAQMAVEQLRTEINEEYKFFALELPYSLQSDEGDVKLAIDFIRPDKVININIKSAVDSSANGFKLGTGENLTDYLKGNVKARERMKAQYDFAGYYNLLVIGTDHAAESLTGFFTKYGDGGADILPLFGLNKRQARIILEYLGAPEKLYLKKPTADLLDEFPCRPDEDELGIRYEEIDDYLEGKELTSEIMDKIEKRYLNTEHKRRLAVTPIDNWWI